MRRLFLPSARQLNVLIPLGLSALGYALYLRYLVIEQTPVGLACEGGLQTWLCATRNAVISFYQHDVFGALALGAAILHVVRPSLTLFAIGLVVACFGIVLYNAGLAGLAVAILILGFARPVLEPE